MRVISWYIINQKTRMFWSTGADGCGGWVGETEADRFTAEEKEKLSGIAPHLPIDGTWFPQIIGPITTTDELAEVMTLFPKGTPLAGYHWKVEGHYNVKMFGAFLDRETKEDRESGDEEDEGENAAFFALIALF